MRLSLFSLFDHYRDRPRTRGELFEENLDQCVRADALGYDTWWCAEHHFSDFGCLPNPAVFLAAAAQRTQRIRLGPAVAVLPFRHPVQIAEDYGLVDRLSAGRLVLGVGSGALASEFEGFGLSFEEKRERFDEAIPIVTGALTGSPNNVPAGPETPIFVASQHAAGAESVGEQGYSLLTLLGPDTPVDEFAARVDRFRQGVERRESSPENPEIAVAILVHVAATDEEAIERVAPALTRFLAGHGLDDPPGDPDGQRALASRVTGLFGSEETVRAGLEELRRLGADEVIAWMNFGGLSPEDVADSMQRCASLR